MSVITCRWCIALASFLALAMAGCQAPATSPVNTLITNAPVSKTAGTLTNEAIFADRLYDAEQPVASRWHPNGTAFTVLETNSKYAGAERQTDENGDLIEHPKDLVSYDFDTLERTVILSAEQLVPDGGGQPLVIDDYTWSDDQSRLLLYTNSVKVWRVKSRGDYAVLDLATGKLVTLGGAGAKPSTMQFAKFSPDSRSVAYVREADIFVEHVDTGYITKLTNRANASIINGIMSWAYEEEFGIRDGFDWNEAGTRIAYWQFDTSGVRDFTLINNTDSLYPTLTRIPYPKVGETVSAARVGSVLVESGETVWAKLPGDPRQNYIPRMQWAERDDEYLVQYVNRKQDTNRVFLINADTGEGRNIFTDQEESYLDDFHDVEWLEDGAAFTFVSERSGWRHVHKVSRDGGTVTDLTPGDYDIADLVKVDVEGGWVYFTVSPDNMTQRYLYRVSLDGSGDKTRLTPGKFSGTNAYKMSDDGQYAVHTHSSFTQPPQYRLIRVDGHAELQMLEDNRTLIDRLSALNLGEHKFFQVDARDGLSLDGYLIYPPDFDSGKTYPIINYVYGEVASQTVRDRWGGLRHMWHLMMSQKGYLIASVDNRGTPSLRGRDFRKSLYGGIGILSSRDQADSQKAMQARWSFIDPDRVGIWGHSGGGSMTLNMLFRYPNIYSAGVSRAPVPDQRLYDAIYQERYSGLLNDHEEGYRQGSPITHARNLVGKLLLVHGTGDDNVHYQGTERLIDELVRHNRQFDFMSYPNRAHGLRAREGTLLHLHSMMSDYFDEHLAASP
ncbi:MAG: DPP IV N-terminal domain-containing protein [Pseudomonadota bacterium]